MVKTLLSLKLRIAKNTLLRSPLAIIGTFFAVLYFGGMYVAAVAFIIAGAGFLDAGAYYALVAVAGILMAVVWMLFPLFFTGMDGTIEPRSLAVWMPPSQRLARALIVVTALDASGIGSLIIAVCIAIGWFIQGHTLTGVMALVLAPLAWLLWVYSARVVTAYFSRIATRKTRERMFMLFFLIIMMMAFTPQILSGLFSHDTQGESGLSTIVNANDVGSGSSLLRALWVIVSIIPTAWPLAAPLSYVQGAWAVGALQVAGSVVMLWALNRLWNRQLAVVMTGAQRTVSKHSAYAESAADFVWAQRLSRVVPTPVAAVAARSLRYWRQDPRYLSQFVAVMAVALMPVVGMYMGSMGSEDSHALGVFPVVLACGLAGIFMGVSVVNDVGMDSTAIWTHIAAGLSGTHDRWGRILGAAIWQIPLLIIIAVGLSVLDGSSTGWLVGLGVGLAAWGGSMATSSVMSALSPSETHAPGESMMKSKTSSNAFFGALLQLLTMAVDFILVIPIIVYLVVVHFVVDAIPLVSVFPVGIAWSAMLVWLGVRWGGRVYDAGIVRDLSTISSWDQAKV